MSDAADWERIEQGLAMRAGGRCEIRSPWCLGQSRRAYGKGIVTTGHIDHLPRHRRSLHHRRPRGAGGTTRLDVDSYAALIFTCGDGTVGCHGFVESYRSWAYERGLLVPNNGTGPAVDPAEVILVLPSYRRVLLDPDQPFYLPPPDGIEYLCEGA